MIAYHISASKTNVFCVESGSFKESILIQWFLVGNHGLNKESFIRMYFENKSAILMSVKTKNVFVDSQCVHTQKKTFKTLLCTEKKPKIKVLQLC